MLFFFFSSVVLVHGVVCQVKNVSDYGVERDTKIGYQIFNGEPTGGYHQVPPEPDNQSITQNAFEEHGSGIVHGLDSDNLHVFLDPVEDNESGNEGRTGFENPAPPARRRICASNVPSRDPKCQRKYSPHHCCFFSFVEGR